MDTIIKYPVYYDSFGQMIFDKDNNLVCDIRCWGHIQYLTDPEKKQDDMGQFITDAINDKLMKLKKELE